MRGEDGQYRDFTEFLNADSMTEIDAWVEPIAGSLPPEAHYQFERLGYFVTDRYDHTPESPVFNRTVTLRDTWQTGKDKK